MSTYTILTDWVGKDSLSDSDANKVVSGSDFQTEFEAVQSALNDKAESGGGAGVNFTAALLAASTVTSTGSVTSNTDVVAGNDGTGALKWGTGGTNTVGTNATGAKTVSTSAPSGGSDGDVHYQV